MSNARKTQAKYGAKIPTAPSAGAKAAAQSKTEAQAPAKTAQEARNSGDKKR